MFGIKQLGLLGLVTLLAACAGPSGMAPIDDRARGGQRGVPATTSGQHVVQRGETLYQIAFRYGWDWKALAAANGLREPFTIYPGQQIRLGAGRAPTVAAAQPARPTAPRSASTPPRTSQPARTSTQVAAPAARPAAPAKTVSLPVNVAGWAWPVQGPLLSRFQSNGSLNKGIDIAGQLGQPVKAAASGAVVYAGRGLLGYGDMIIVKHNETYLSAYAHNSKLLVSEGDQVKVGQVIAEMGSSGTDRVKLHFEIRRKGQPVDPLSYLPKS
ncbi:peptidoglycan DD-metalloendopeptidase family protein [Halopseudomonas pelagia]|uniref:peptidoglycan DD-metalloendopeptidase family protein n=1 Tax=Halopseudomonas pelagia TaxID=553151 RepID=UPI0003A3B50C|nr:peptidoglycan DD-metalloendopeptidase family protein [Halopseudomonas pelagia]|tara:strand:- start:33956 stop:34765 length:810 start_codon:yes stop_codon:yes gene_type:complete